LAWLPPCPIGLKVFVGNGATEEAWSRPRIRHTSGLLVHQAIFGPERAGWRSRRRAEERDARADWHPFCATVPRRLPRKISSGRVADRRVKIVPVERYRLSFIEAVDDLASVHPIVFCFAEVIA
jgi:hypothetical protein